MKNISKISLFLFVASFFLLTSSVSAETLQERDQRTIDNYNSAKSSYAKVVNEYKSAKSDFIKAKNQYVQYRNKESLNATLEQAKNYLNKAIDVLSAHINLVQSGAKNVSLTGGLTDDQKQMIASELNAEKDWLTQEKSLLTSAATKDQLVSHGKMIQSHWNSIRIIAKKITGEVLVDKINWAIAKGDAISTEVKVNIDNLKAQNKDTSILEGFLADLDKNLSLAKQKRDSAKSIFDQIGTSPAGNSGVVSASDLTAANDLFNKGNDFIKQANQYAASAHKDLKEIVRQINSPRFIGPPLNDNSSSSGGGSSSSSAESSSSIS
ncbi:MAG: hypothetical protein KGJ58_02145 [Patescibacteria group bacterium]|nr:hypothetical protein [Patescibacteria group bacterium]MDE1988332.1 hypothetical protein [Patescibacteria group bacterium]MDE2218228.1 hypothetical protein [Patescibacteria group bacterium]